jgi:DNA-binding CsgD family transcriptional regulator
MLEGFLSTDAATLYARLALTPDGLLDDGNLAPAAVAELRRLGLAFRTSRPAARITPVSPTEAFDRLLAISERETRAVLDGLVRLLGDLDVTRRHRPLPSSGADDASITAIGDPTDIRCVAERLRAEATGECLALVGSRSATAPPRGWAVPPWSGNSPSVATVRIVYGTSTVAHATTGTCRVTPDVRIDALIVDGTAALVALPDVPRPALLVRSLPAVGLLRRWFELLWQRGEPVGSAVSPLGPYQRRILTLMAAGHRDAHVARITGTSTRTVRRHVAAMMRELGVSTRFEAGVAARRLGWFEPFSTSATG